MRWTVPLLAVVALGAGCRGSREPPPARPADAATPLDMILPAYPLVEGADDPLAARLCGALHRLPGDERARCCPSAAPAHDGGVANPQAAAAEERTTARTRALSAAVRGRALRLEAAAVEACVAALSAQHAGCDWVGFEPLERPAACRAVVTGLVPVRTGCRSSLECAERNPCRGLGEGGTGVCRPPLAHGAACAPPADPLATLLRDEGLDESHPACDGHCERGRCAAPITAGGPCRSTAQCSPGLHCVKLRCVPGTRPQAGEPCDGPCQGLARCLAGTCVPASALREGAPCAIDDHCAGRCLRTGDKGRCGPACSR